MTCVLVTTEQPIESVATPITLNVSHIGQVVDYLDALRVHGTNISSWHQRIDRIAWRGSAFSKVSE